MDMAMDTGIVLAQGNMLPFLHLRAQDTLWFNGWVLQSTPALAAASTGLFLLAVASRWLDALRSIAHSQHVPSSTPSIARGALHSAQALLGFAIMLAAM